jgi:hypothetical protein
VLSDKVRAHGVAHHRLDIYLRASERSGSWPRKACVNSRCRDRSMPGRAHQKFRAAGRHSSTWKPREARPRARAGDSAWTPACGYWKRQEAVLLQACEYYATSLSHHCRDTAGPSRPPWLVGFERDPPRTTMQGRHYTSIITTTDVMLHVLYAYPQT